MKILTVVGARPQFVKAAVVSRAIALHNRKTQKNKINEIIVHTGQHYDTNMSDIFFKEMQIPEPVYSLGIGDCSHGSMTGKMLDKIEAVILNEKPDVVLVYGDTNSTLAGSLAAAKLRIPVAHVEAGLRSFNMHMPEEINRILTDRISSFLFCPTETAVHNLSNEGIPNNSQITPISPIVMNVGDVMYDAVLFYKQICRPTDPVSQLVDNLGKNDYYLATIHRAENTDNRERLCNITEAFSLISQDTHIILPLHPRTSKKINEYGLSFNGVHIINPVGYFDMLTLLDNCKAVFTDSGGLQKEAYFFQKPCITLRDETEWVELVEHGYNNVVGANRDDIVNAENKLMKMNIDYSTTLYGKGIAGDIIVCSLINFFR